MEDCINRIKCAVQSKTDKILICGPVGSGKGHCAKLALQHTKRAFKFITFGDLLSQDFPHFYESPRQKLKRLLEEAIIDGESVVLGNLEEFLEEPELWFTLTTAGWFSKLKTAGLPVICTMNSDTNRVLFNTVKDHFLHIINIFDNSQIVRFADMKAAKRESEALQIHYAAVLEKMIQEGRTCGQLSNHDVMLVDTRVETSDDNGFTLETVYGVSEDIKKTLLTAASNNNAHGALLYGPPGTGKTRLALALAGSLGKSTRFISVSAADLLRAEIGTSEVKLRETFALARASQPAIIFFDEIDALFPKNPPFSLLSLQHQLIAEFDSLHLDQFTSGNVIKVFVLAATNHLEKVEKRILGAGRFELQLEIGLPDFQGRFDILKAELGEMDDTDDNTEFIRTLAEKTRNKTPADLMKMIQDARKNSWKRSSSDNDNNDPRLKPIDFTFK